MNFGIWYLCFGIYSLILLISSAALAGPEAPEDAGSARGAATGGRAATEFLERWDRRYRLIDPEIESSRRLPPADYTSAAAELKKAIVTGIGDRDMYYRLGFCYEKLGDHERAIEAYRRAVECLPKDPPHDPLEFYLPFHLGTVYARTGRFREAAMEYERAVEADGEQAAARNNLGYCYSKLALKRKALDEFERAAALDPRLAEAHFNAGVTRAELGDLAGAEGCIKQALGIRPDMQEGRRILGRILHARGRRSEAEEALRSASEESADEAKEGEASKAEGEAERDSLERAKRLLVLGEREKAREEYVQALQRNPRSVEACLGMAYLSEFEGGERYGKGFPAEKSMAYYRKALELEPGHSGAWLNLGNVCERAGRYEDALRAYARVKELSPGMKIASYNLGVCYARLGEWEKAEEQFLDALRIDPSFAQARFQLALLYTELRDYERAIAAYRETLRLDPRDADAHYNLAQIYRKHADRPEDAVKHFRAYLKIRPRADDASQVEEWVRELGAVAVERHEHGGEG